MALDLMSAFKGKGDKRDGTVVFLAYHFLFEDNEDEFRKLLDWLATEYNFLSVTEAVQGINRGSLRGQNICFTCDDGFKSCIKAGAILKEYGATCCFFLCPEFVSLENPEKIRFFNKQRLGGPPIEFLTWAEVEALLGSGHEIGNHTLNHMNLGTIGESEAKEQIELSLDLLKQKIGMVRHFACPYGQPSAYTTNVVEYCYKLGHESFFTTSRGLHWDKTSVERGLFKRHHFEPFWPVRHTRYFLK